GIRDRNVTGVQTCALPIFGCCICVAYCVKPPSWVYNAPPFLGTKETPTIPQDDGGNLDNVRTSSPRWTARQHRQPSGRASSANRSEERRVGKAWRSRWARR